jgi:hypothetical protein
MADKDWLGSLTGSAKESDSRFKADAAQRREAAKVPGSIILSQNDILTGRWDAGKVLLTTIGGELRHITQDDLKTFRYNINAVKSRFVSGLSAKQIIDLSLTQDRNKAKEDIKHATPVSFNNGEVKFLTNAGGTTKGVTRHHVVVHFLGYGVEAASGSLDAKKSAARMKKGKLKFDCDCGRHRYWFRYIATIGGYNAGRAETGFPKIRNPKLFGVACKHVLRVMAEIERGGMVLSFLARAMAKAKAHDEAKASIKQSQKDAENLIKSQGKRDDHAIKTSDQKKNEAAAKKAQSASDKAAIAKLMAEQSKKATKATASKMANSATDKVAALRAAMAVFGIEPTQEQIDAVTKG